MLLSTAVRGNWENKQSNCMPYPVRYFSFAVNQLNRITIGLLENSVDSLLMKCVYLSTCSNLMLFLEGNAFPYIVLQGKTLLMLHNREKEIMLKQKERLFCCGEDLENNCLWPVKQKILNEWMKCQSFILFQSKHDLHWPLKHMLPYVAFLVAEKLSEFVLHVSVLNDRIWDEV